MQAGFGPGKAGSYPGRGWVISTQGPQRKRGQTTFSLSARCKRQFAERSFVEPTTEVVEVGLLLSMGPPMQGKTFEIVRIDQIHEIVSPTIESLLQPLGFEVQGPLSWLRSVDAPIRQLFRLEQWKGGALAPSWALSLDFVPHLSGNEIKWHRTSKSARPDLTFDVRDRAFDISCSCGPDAIATSAPNILRAAIPKAESFWDEARSIADLPGAFERVKQHLSTGGLGFYNYIQHPLAYAFVLAMNGKPDTAEEEFQRYSQRLSEAARKKLRKLFIDAGGHLG
eukprot:gene5138-5957_t